MITKNQILEKITELKNYCITNGESTGDYAGFISVLTEPINNYYSHPPDGLLDKMNYLIPQIFNDLMYRSTTYENPIGKPLSTDYPQGYADLAALFDGGGAFTEIMNMDAETFLNGFPVETVTDGTTGTSSTVVKTNPIIAAWTAEINAAHSAELDKIQAIISFCERGSYNQGLISMFEDRGTMTRTKSNRDLAHEIYIDKKYKDVIQSFNLDVHIPTFL